MMPVGEHAPTPGVDPPPWSADQQRSAQRLLAAGVRTAALDRLSELAARALGTASAQVSLLTDVQTAVAGHGLPPGTIGRGTPLRDSMCLVAASSGAVLAVSDARVDPRVAHGAKAVSGEIAAYLGVPLVDAHRTTVGSLCVFDPRPRDWTPNDVALLEQLALSARAELELAALSREYDTDRARWELAVEASNVGTFDWDLPSGDLAWDARLIALYGYDHGVPFGRAIDAVYARVHPDDAGLVSTAMAEAIAGVGPISVVYRIVVPPGQVRWLEARGRALPAPDEPDGPAVRLLGISWDVTDVQVGQTRADRVVASMPLGYLALDARWRVTAANPEAARIARSTPELMLGRDFWDLHPVLVGSAFETTYRRVAATGVPESVVGFHPEPSDTWFDVRVVGHLDGIALYLTDVTQERETRRRLEIAARHDRTVAQTLQRVLLATLPNAPGYDLAGRYRTAAHADEVGGDWYDALVQGGGRLTVAIGDVVGHDIAAAAVMGQLRAMLRMSSWSSTLSPSHSLRQLDLAGRDMHLDAMATVALCRIESPATGGGPHSMAWSNAGHPPPVVLDPDGSTRVLGTSEVDVMLGVVPEADRHDHTVELPSGAVVFLYTDGMVENRDMTIDRGVRRLRDALVRHRHLELDALVEQVMADTVGDSPCDDAAALAVRVGNDPGHVVVLAHGPDAPGRARHHLDAHLPGLHPDMLDDARLLVSELVSNAVRHGGSVVRLRALPTAGGVHVSVYDDGVEVDDGVRVLPATTAVSGRGLPIVAAVADRWGVTANSVAPGKWIWFELGDRSAGSAAPA